MAAAMATPCARPKLQHTLNVFSKERRLYRKAIWCKKANQLINFTIDQLQAPVVVELWIKAENIHFSHMDHRAIHLDDAVPHQERSGIDTKNYFTGLFQTAVFD